MRAYFVPVFLLFISCNPTDRLTPELKENLLFTLKKNTDFLSLDSFKLVRFDTITARSKMNANFRNILDTMTNYRDDLSRLTEDMLRNIQLAKLNNGLSSALFEFYKSKAEEDKVKIDQLKVSYTSFNQRADSLTKAAERTDSVNAIGYTAICFFQVTRKDRSVLRDTIHILLNSAKQIVNYEDFIRN